MGWASNDHAIPGYSRAQPIGEGGSSIVYRSWDEAFGRWVAIKVICGRPGPHALAEFDRECHAMGALSGHPGIVTVHSRGTTEAGHPFLVMELLAGSLADLVRVRGPLPIAQAIGIGLVVCEALSAAHAVGVLHRDVKPENVLRSTFGIVKLSDFGIARIESDATTQSMGFEGTYPHAAPEVLAGDDPTSASDVYSLASTIFTLLSGKAPFQRDGDDLFRLLARIANEAPTDLRRAEVPAPICAAIEEGLVKDPRDRPPTADEFRCRLQAAATEIGVSVERSLDRPDDPASGWRPPASYAPGSTTDAPATAVDHGRPATPVTVDVDQASSAPDNGGRGSKWRRRPVRVLTVVLCVGAGALALGLIALGDGGRPSGAPPPTPAAAGPEVVFADDFSRPLGWEVRDNDQSALGYADGQLRVVVKNPNRFYNFRAPTTNLPARVGVEASAVAQQPSASLGIVCRGHVNGPKYLADIRNDGFWRLSRYDADGGPKILVESRKTGEYATSTHTTGANVIALECLGSDAADEPVTLRFSINGQSVATYVDLKGLGQGGVGVAVVTQDAPIEARFDDFRVTGVS